MASKGRKRSGDGITRRDFLEGVLIAAGGMAVLASSPAAWAHYPPGTTFPPDGAIGLDPRVLRGGNLRDTFTPAHWLRDERLTWSSSSVSIKKSDVDSFKGSFPILTDTGSYDVIVVGGGIAGLSTAFNVRKLKPDAKVLILENNPRVGGNASRDDASPSLTTQASTAGAYIVYPYDDFLFDFYDTIGVEYAQNIVTAPFYSYYFSLVAFPGGTSYIARRALKHLIPASISGSSQNEMVNNPINFAELDKTSNGVRYRIGANALRADTGPTGAQVTYYLNGQFQRASCKAIVLAGQMHTAHRLIDHLLTPERLDAASKYQHIPVPIANVAVRNSQFLVNAGTAYDYYWYGSRLWQDAVMADYVKVMNDPARRDDGSRPNVLTFYSGFFTDPATTRREERVKLLTTPFVEYEDSLREDMTRIFGPSGFDWDRDVSAVSLYRWGHGMVVPYVGWIFGVPTNGLSGQVTRTDGPRTIGRQPLGRISFASQDTEGTPAIESAIFSGKRTAEEVAAFL
jgi:putative NAD(P)-binding protein/flavin-dependent amine oxidoreductase